MRGRKMPKPCVDSIRYLAKSRIASLTLRKAAFEWASIFKVRST